MKQQQQADATNVFRGHGGSKLASKFKAQNHSKEMHITWNNFCVILGVLWPI